MAVTSTLPIAGLRLGLSSDELKKFLEDSENGEQQFFDITLQDAKTPQRGTQASFLSKGKGDVLGYQKGGMPTVKYEGPAEEVTSMVTTPQSTAQPSAPAATPEPEDTRRSLGSIAGEYGASGLFGHQDYFKSKEAGYSDEEIRSYLAQNPSMVAPGNRPGSSGGLYEELVRGQVDPGKAQTRSAASAPSPQPTFSLGAGQSAEYLGHADVEAAKQSGASTEQIKEFLIQNASKLRGGNVPGGGGLWDEYFG